jgi:short-subunit dehydrogenase
MSTLLAEKGHDLFLVGRDVQRLEDVARVARERWKAQAVTLPINLADDCAPSAILADLDRRGLHADVLINNAGFNVYGPFRDTPLEQELEMIHVHIGAITALTKLVLPGMLDRRSGRILITASTGSLFPCPLDAVYCATKAYAFSFAVALSEEVRGSGVTVTALLPGATATDFAARAGMGKTKLFVARLAMPRAVAETGYRAMMKGKPMVVAGFGNKVLVGARRVLPLRPQLKAARRRLVEA